METNQTVYYYPYAKIISMPSKPYVEIHEGAEYPMALSRRRYSENQIWSLHDVEIIVPSVLGLNYVAIPLIHVNLFVMIIEPKFKIGDIVIDKEGKTLPWRIWEYTLSHGKIWYRDGWGYGQNLESGRYEDGLRLANPDEIEKESWAIAHNDDIAKRRK